MDLFEALRTRRSIRKYTEDNISDDDLHAMLDAAMHAPSARNQQPWHFVVARRAEIREALSKASPYTHMAAKAPLVIVIAADMNACKVEEMWVQDCAAATENMLLAARGRDIGTVWCGIYPVADRMESIRQTLALPPHIIPFNLVCAGHTSEEFREEQRYQQDRIHMDRW